VKPHSDRALDPPHALAQQISGGYDLPALATRQSLANDSAMASPRRARRPSTPWWEAEMATEPERPSLTQRHRQVLQVLAIAPLGRDVNALLTLGFKLKTMADLVRSKLATVRVEIVENRDSKIEFAIIQITDAGWRALEGLTPPRRSPHPPEDQ
jgi:hypothetical protein